MSCWTRPTLALLCQCANVPTSVESRKTLLLYMARARPYCGISGMSANNTSWYKSTHSSRRGSQPSEISYISSKSLDARISRLRPSVDNHFIPLKLAKLLGRVKVYKKFLFKCLTKKHILTPRFIIISNIWGFHTCVYNFYRVTPLVCEFRCCTVRYAADLDGFIKVFKA